MLNDMTPLSQNTFSSWWGMPLLEGRGLGLSFSLVANSSMYDEHPINGVTTALGSWYLDDDGCMPCDSATWEWQDMYYGMTCHYCHTNGGCSITLKTVQTSFHSSLLQVKPVTMCILCRHGKCSLHLIITTNVSNSKSRSEVKNLELGASWHDVTEELLELLGSFGTALGWRESQGHSLLNSPYVWGSCSQPMQALCKRD